MELILVEMLRHETPKVDDRSTGLIAGLLDPAIASVLLAMHGEIAREWSVAELAHLCGVSRLGFATRFKEVLGVGPIEYLMRWRMAVAKDELRRGTRSISEIALQVGFQSRARSAHHSPGPWGVLRNGLLEEGLVFPMFLAGTRLLANDPRLT